MNYKIVSLEETGWTPESLFFALNPKDYSVLLQSGRFHAQTARYSYLCFEPSALFQANATQYKFIDFETGKEKQGKGDPLDFLKEKLSLFSNPNPSSKDLPPFLGGAIGIMGYESLQWTEPISLTPKPGLAIPDLLFLFFNWGIVFDHSKKNISLFALNGFEEKIDCWKNKILSIPKDKNKKFLPSLNSDNSWQSNFSKQAFCDIVKKAKEYITAGDIFQVNLAQRLSCKTSVKGEELYTCLNAINPSPFSAYFKAPDFEVISCSPERLVQLDQNIAQTRPIAGTRPRLSNSLEDLKLEQELQKNKKERAEHIMLLDLERNDLGRVSEFGSVVVDEFLTIENYSHVRHLVSNVRGKLKEGADPIDLLKAMFPGGTITGTPKVRAMEIIEELETVQRNMYTGSLGYFSYTGQIDFNILIRTFIKKKDSLYLHAGAGIVADSIPEKEYDETLHKAKALMQALTLAEKKTNNLSTVSSEK